MNKIKILLALLLIAFCFCFCSFAETRYTKEGNVIEINNNLVTVKDKCGYLWDFEGDGFKINERVKLTMDTNHTDSNIFDDKVIDVKEIKAQ